MKPLCTARIIALSLTAIIGTAHASAPKPDPTTERIITNVAPLMENLVVEKVIPSKAGLYELVTPAGIFYTDKNGSFVIFNGVMVDSKTKTNLTEERMESLSTFKFSELPLGDSFKIVRGDGSRVMATFEDPNCGFCKKLAQEVKKLDNVTIHVFLMPVLGPDSIAKAKAIWCSKDPGQVWTDHMTGAAKLPEGADTTCANPIERNVALGRKLRINGTPAILFPNNKKTPGFVQAEVIKAKLEASQK